MAKILLAYDDYAVMMSAETAFKKGGHEVRSLNSEANIIEQISEYLPDFVIAYGSGEKVNCLRVGEKLKGMGDYNGFVVLIFAPHARPTPDDLIRVRVDHVLEAPVPPARLTTLVTNSLKDKKQDKIFVRSKPSASKLNTHEDSTYVQGAHTDLTKQIVKNDPNEAENSSLKKPTNEQDSEIRLKQEQERNKSSAPAPVASQPSPSIPATKAPEKAPAAPAVRSNPQPEENQPERSPEKQNKTPHPVDSLFGSLDLKSLEREVLGNLPPKKTVLEEMAEIRAKEAAGFYSSTPPAQDEPLNLDIVHADLREAQEKRKARAEKYKNLTLPSFDLTKSTVNKRSAKNSLREMAKEWSEAELKSQDELRREFIKNLLKK
jgi:hypothetical protein